MLVGRNGWLFYRPDVRYLVEPPSDGGPQVAASNAFPRSAPRARASSSWSFPCLGKPSLYGEMLTRRLNGVEADRFTDAHSDRAPEAGRQSKFSISSSCSARHEGASPVPLYLATRHSLVGRGCGDRGAAPWRRALKNWAGHGTGTSITTSGRSSFPGEATSPE